MKPTPYKLKKSDIKRIVELYLEGYNSKELAKMFGVSSRTILYHLGKAGVIRNRSEAATLRHNKNVNLTPSPELAYIIGAFLGDGHVGEVKSCERKGKVYKRWRFRLKVTSREFVESVAEACRRIGLRPHIFKCDSPYYITRATYQIPYELVVYSKPLCLLLRDIKENLNLLKKYIEGFEKEFLRGLYEAEGSVNRSGEEISYVTAFANTNKDLIQLVYEMLKHFKPYIIEYKPKNKNCKTQYYVRLNLCYGKKFLKWINPCIKTLSKICNLQVMS